MSLQERIYSCDSLPWFVEFVGPGCSGKTTLIKCLKSSYEREFSYIGPPKLTRLSRAVTRLREYFFNRRLFNAYRLDAFSRDRLEKGFSTVTGGLGWYSKCRGEIFVVDEGPFRVLMDYAVDGDIPYQIWRNFCLRTLEELSRYKILLVVVQTDPAVRVERGKARIDSSRKGVLKGYPATDTDMTLPRRRSFFREEAISLLEAGRYRNFHLVTLDNDNEVQEVALRARHLIHAHVACARA